MINMKRTSRDMLILTVVVGSVAIAIGVIIGYFGRPLPKGPCLGSNAPENIITDGDPSVYEKLRDEISEHEIRKHLYNFTRTPHVGGTKGSHDLAEVIASKWREYGLDRIEKKTYNVLLSYPDEDNPNYVRLYDSGNLVYQSAPNEEIPGENNTGIIQPYNAYAPKGNFSGDMVYVNYCRREDFEDLLKFYTIDFRGKIVICRYGKIFRGSKVAIASSYNATGVVLYNDPKDYAVEGMDKVYPDTWWLPPTGVQRGSVYAEQGDPLTPGYPSIESAYRLEEDKAEGLPHIPSHPLGYGDAYHFLKELDGPEVTENLTDWQGGLNFTYRIGPLKPNKRIQLTVNNENRRADAVNLFGYITGSVEPDRYVLVGSHRDAWAFGALDPTSGTSVMVEMSRAMGKLKREGWQPRRTIIFCSWGAEEFGLVGSFEWVEEYVKKISGSTVAYLNLDTVVKGNHTIAIDCLPLLESVVYEAAKVTATANKPGASLFDEWLVASPDPLDSTKPQVGLLGAGSDHAAFYIFAGVPAVDFEYTFDKKQWNVLDYPVYHTGIETFRIFEKFIDPEFKHTRSITQYAAEIVRRLSDSHVIPYDLLSYGEAIKKYITTFLMVHKTTLDKKGISIVNFVKSGVDFDLACKSFIEKMKTMNTDNPYEVRAYNDVMMMIERAFLDPQGLPGRPLYRHVVFAPSLADNYAGSAFPGLIDALYKIEGDPNEMERWEIFKKHFATVTFIINGAADMLNRFRYI